MTTLQRSFVIAALHLALAGSLAAKMFYDRAAEPRVWAQAEEREFQHIEGSYVTLYLLVDRDVQAEASVRRQLGVGPSEPHLIPCRLEIRDGRLFATAIRRSDRFYNSPTLPGSEEEDERLKKYPPTLHGEMQVFVPPETVDPDHLDPGQKLWVEVTVPQSGALRPIQLAVSDAKGWHLLGAR